jgi:hypothetical protein
MESLIIRCIRNNKDSKTDDVIFISPSCLGYYTIKTYYAEINKSYTQTISYSNVFAYINSLIILLINDDQPFEFIQLDIPNTPAVSFKTNNLNSDSMYKAINNILHVTLETWRLRGNQIVAPTS